MLDSDILKLAAEAVVDPRTVRRWLADPDKVYRHTAERLDQAAKKLGIKKGRKVQ